jgi:hypothetical protein
MTVIAYKITIGSSTFKSQDNTILKELMVNSALNIPVNSAEISIANIDGADIKLGDPVTIELGADGNTKTVFTGKVGAVAAALNLTQIVAVSGVEPLTRNYCDMTFENKSAGEIFKQMMAISNAATGKVEDGVKFSRYVITNGKNIWQHLKLLSQYSGTDLYTDAGDKVNFIKYQKSSGITFTYGETILEAEKETVAPPIDGIEVFGESPAGQGQSDEANFWFKKDEVIGRAGKTSGTVIRRSVFAARNKNLCDTIAANLFDDANIKATGRVVVLNGESIELGRTITLKNVPVKGIDGSYKVTAMKHLLNEQSGFTTEILWEEKA